MSGLERIVGRAWKFGDDVSTDHITPGRYLHLRSNLPELAKHVFEDLRGDFAQGVGMGDFVVAGKNFGQGSSREYAPLLLKTLGVGAVLAKSFARIFFRNAINLGLPAVTCDTDAIEERDRLELRLLEGKLVNLTRGVELRFPPLPKNVMSILAEGGLIPYIKKHGDLSLG